MLRWLVLVELAATLAEFVEVDDGLLVLRWWLLKVNKKMRRRKWGLQQHWEEGNGLRFIRIRVKLMRVYIEREELG